MSEYHKGFSNKWDKNKKSGLISSNFIESLDFSQNQTIKQSLYCVQQCQDYNSSESQSQDDEQCFQIDEQICVYIPHKSKELRLISSINQPKVNLMSSIDVRKRNYAQILKKKEQNRKKFIEKMNFCIEKQNKVKLLQIPSNNCVNLKHKQQSRTNTLRNNTSKENNIQKRDQNKFIEKREQEEYKSIKSHKVQTSEKKKIKLKRKNSQAASQKTIEQNHDFLNDRLDRNTNKDLNAITMSKRQSVMNMSKNQFLFLQQYQKDQKQIMNRLLNIIQKQQDTKQQSNNLYQSAHQYNSIPDQHINTNNSRIKMRSLASSKRVSKPNIQTAYSSSKPIVINNYIKSPTQYLDKNLLEKQITIRLLEQNRKKKQVPFLCSNKKNNIQQHIQSPYIQSKNKKDILNQPQNNKKLSIALSGNQKSNKLIELDVDEINFQKLFHKMKTKTENSNQSNSNQSKSNQSKSDQSKSTPYQNSPQNNVNKNIPNTSNQTEIQTTKTTPQIQQFNFVQKQKQHKQKVQKQLDKIVPQTKNQKIKLESHLQTKKQSILMEISFRDQNYNIKSNVSLADAFKKKFGQNKFSKNNKVLSSDKSNKSNQPNKIEGYSSKVLSELKINQNNWTSQGKIQRLPQSGTVKKQNIKISRKQLVIQKQNFNSIQTPRSQSQIMSISDRSMCTNMSNLSKQPSKQLIDRLIYGGKATMSKKQMYQLSKKNYMKLPQIEQKRKQQQKKLKQVERLDKIKQYQKRIRSSKNSMCKQSMKSSIQVEIK